MAKRISTLMLQAELVAAASLAVWAPSWLLLRSLAATLPHGLAGAASLLILLEG